MYPYTAVLHEKCLALDKGNAISIPGDIFKNLHDEI